MDSKYQNVRGARAAGPTSKTLRQSLVLIGVLALLVAPAVRAAGDRTALRPGWNMFSPQQDIEVGQQVSLEAERELPLLKNARVDTYVNNLGRRLAAKAPGEKYPYTFKVVNDRTINAFALPGGPVYVNRGVIEAAENESQLAGVIAHEISHVALRHGTNQASKASAAQMPLAILGGLLGSDSTKAALAQLGANFAVNSVLLKYSRSAESQADLLGTQILYDLGYDPRAMGQFFEKIEAEQNGKGPVEFFSNHPSPDNRIEAVNGEVDALGGARRDSTVNSREFDEIKRHVQSLPVSNGQQLQGGRQTSNPELMIVSASYGANGRFIDVRQRMQDRAKGNRLDLQVNASSMGGNPINQAKTLQVRYRWDDRAYDVTVKDNQRLLIPTVQQISAANGQSNGNTSTPTGRFLTAENSVLLIQHPADWQVYGQGDAMTITPPNGMTTDGNGNRALAYGVIANVFEPRLESYGRQLQGPGQSPVQNSSAKLEQSTDQLVQELRLSNRNMRVIRYGEAIRVNGSGALSTYLSNDSPLGDREANWLVTVEHPDGLLFIIFTAPERDFQSYEGTFHEMLRSVRIKK